MVPFKKPQSEYLVLLCLGGYFVGLLKRYHYLGKKALSCLMELIQETCEFMIENIQ